VGGGWSVGVSSSAGCRVRQRVGAAVDSLTTNLCNTYAAHRTGNNGDDGDNCDTCGTIAVLLVASTKSVARRRDAT